MLKTLDYTIRIGSIHRPFYISICISTLSTQHTTFIDMARSRLTSRPAFKINSPELNLTLSPCHRTYKLYSYPFYSHKFTFIFSGVNLLQLKLFKTFLTKLGDASHGSHEPERAFPFGLICHLTSKYFCI